MALNKTDIINKIQSYKPVRISSALRRASVAIILRERADDFDVFFTVRSPRMTEHAGQVAFPGGRMDKQDHTVIQTAVRETFEETRIRITSADRIGIMDDFLSNSHYHITPIVFRIAGDPEIVLNEEVSEVFWAPLSHLADPTNQRHQTVHYEQMNWDMHEFHMDAYRIWGVTGWILNHFISVSVPSY